MNNLLKAITLLICSLPLSAQHMSWKELENWDKPEYRRYRSGEEVKAMIQEAERRDKSPLLKTRVPLITNADILQMKKAEFTDGTIIGLIQTRQSWFDLSPDALILLKSQGISESLLNAMIDAERDNSNRLIPTNKYGLPTEIGIYVLQRAGYVEIDAEPISWKGGGVWKSILTGAAGVAGFAATGFPFFIFTTKGHVNAKVMQPRSRFVVERNAEVIVRTPEGVAASEYLLVRLYEKDNRREFRLITGGVTHRSSGAERTSVPFSYYKIAPRSYAINIGNLASGEYGFLPTFQMKDISSAFVGKLYSFSVD